MIDKNIKFSLDDCVSGYTPQRGDWITATVEDIEEKNGKIYCNLFLRENLKSIYIKVYRY